MLFHFRRPAAIGSSSGLALEAVEPAALMPRVLEMAAVFASLPLTALITNKQLMVEPHREAMHQAMWREIRALEDHGVCMLS